MVGEEGDRNTALGAHTQQRRRAQHMAKADDALERVDRHAQPVFLLDAHQYGFPVARQIGVLRSDKQRIE